LARDLADGRVLGVWNTEPPPGVQIVAGPSGPVLRGGKSYATGAGHIDLAVVTATLPEGGRQMVIVDADDAERADASAWRTRGMKATLSGSYDLTGLPADGSRRLGGPDDYVREPMFSAGAWRFTAVQLGGIERVAGLLRDHLASGPAGEAAVPRARFAEAVTALRTAWLWVREAAARAESLGAGADDIAVVQLTRGVVDAAGQTVMDAAARVVGSRAFFTDNPLDLACRDLAFYLRQPLPDLARDAAAGAFIARDAWSGDRLW
jgi:alkylation response protein AidB-like acyl-CoA dehydrogenase